MKAAVYHKFKQPIRIQSLRDPEPGDNGVVIKVGASGLCLSDWHGWMGHDQDIVLPHVPGHEFAGTIVEVGKHVKKWVRDKRITVPFVCGCGSCEPCTSGNQQVCDHQFQPGFTAWGSFAEYVAVEYAEENLVALPPEMDFVSAASLGCRFITAYRALKFQGKLEPEQYIAIHGCGGVGLSAIQIGKALGAQVIAIDISEDKCKLAAELGADHSINASANNVVEAVKEISGGGVQLSIDALGSRATCLNSIMNLRKRGKHIQVGLMTDNDANPPIPMSMIIANELEILGSHGMQAHKYPGMFDLIASAKINLDKMITSTVSLNDIPLLLPKMDQYKSSGITVVNTF